MAVVRLLTGLSVILLLTLLPSCSQGDDSGPPPLENSYLGTLSFDCSRDVPGFTVVTNMDVSIQKDRKVTFGSGGNQSFDEEDTIYEAGIAVTRVRMTGTVRLIEARGAWYLSNDEEYLLVLRHATVEGRMMVWNWKDGTGWVQVQDSPYAYEDTYDDGETQFAISDALLDGSDVSVTVPDDHGATTYGYTLRLSAGDK